VFDFGQADRGQAPALSMVDPLRLSIPARDGLALDGTLLLPPGNGSDPALRYPIFLDTYSGPDAPTVANRYRPSAWLQFLAQRGCLVLQVNVRTASGRGQAFTGLVYRRFLELELADLEAAVAFVLERYQGDPSRVALSGWSYGGSITAYALTHSKTFSLGFAGAGVYDWRLYDSIYTERYMQTPDLNPDGYRQSSVIEAAKELSGHLVLLHGTIDDNVHLQNTIQLVDELQKAGKQNFELMLYPNARHGVSSKHRLPYMWGVLRREFGLPAAPAAAPAPAEAPLDGR
jgi:dipeptidyl-peptidase-4